jgi:serine phosphatase RsbU (regulator of sigma subunit)
MSLLEETFSDHFVFFRPKQKVSGDFYWWTRVEERVIVAAADCTGHGVPGAFMSMLGVSLLREIVNREYITHPGVVLNRLRKEVIRSLDQKGEHGEQKDGMDLALISVQPGTLACDYAGANNPLYLVRDGELTEYRADHMPISHYPRLDKFTNHEIQLQKGDQLYLFSDGYADQFGGEKRKKFKYKNFARLLVETTSRPMREQHDILLKTIVAWQGEIEQIDDMVIVGIKI